MWRQRLPHLCLRSAICPYLWMIHRLSCTSRRTDVLQTYITKIHHLERSSSVRVTLLVGAVAHDDFLEQSSEREFRCVDVLRSCIPENDSPILLTRCTEKFRVCGIPRYVVYVVGVAAGEMCRGYGMQHTSAHAGFWGPHFSRCQLLQGVHHHSSTRRESSLARRVFEDSAVHARGACKESR